MESLALLMTVYDLPGAFPRSACRVLLYYCGCSADRILDGEQQEKDRQAIRHFHHKCYPVGMKGAKWCRVPLAFVVRTVYPDLRPRQKTTFTGWSSRQNLGP